MMLAFAHIFHNNKNVFKFLWTFDWLQITTRLLHYTTNRCDTKAVPGLTRTAFA